MSQTQTTMNGTTKPSPRAVRISKTMSFALRHKPGALGLVLDEAGFVEVTDLLEALARDGLQVTRAELDEVVHTSDKKRFGFSADGARIRAHQGHSVEVDLGYAPEAPPEVLLHGTVAKFVESIRERGLVRGSRTHVHLSRDRETAHRVAARRGKPVILEVAAARMAALGHVFYKTPNDVWLVEHVPPEFVTAPPVHGELLLGRFNRARS